MRRNTRRYWTQQTLLVVRIVASGIRLNDAFLKTLLKAAKKTLRQPTTRAEFSYEKLFLGGGGGEGSGRLSLSTAAYSENIRYKLDN